MGEGIEGSVKWAVAITINPNYLSDECITAYKEWCSKQCKFFKIITEKEDTKRHIHSILLLEKWKDTKGRRLDKVKEAVWKFQKKFDESCNDASKHVCYNGVKVVYNEEWVTKYMDKGDNTISICDNLIENYQDYLPTAEEQLEWIRLKEEKENGLVKDHFFNKLLKLFDEHRYNEGWQECKGLYILEKRHTAIFLYDMMYKKKSISVIRDAKLRKNIINCFPSYYNGSVANWLQDFSKEELLEMDLIDKSC